MAAGLALLGGSCLALTGCGQKGPLTLPVGQPAATNAAAAHATDAAARPTVAPAGLRAASAASR